MRQGTGLDDDVMFSILLAASVCVRGAEVYRGSPEAPEEPGGPGVICEWIQVGSRCSHISTHKPAAGVITQSHSLFIQC